MGWYKERGKRTLKAHRAETFIIMGGETGWGRARVRKDTQEARDNEGENATGLRGGVGGRGRQGHGRSAGLKASASGVTWYRAVRIMLP